MHLCVRPVAKNLVDQIGARDPAGVAHGIEHADNVAGAHAAQFYVVVTH